MRLSNQIIVSNRLPISAVRSNDGAISFAESSGGLATAMSSLESDAQVWVGWCGLASDTLTPKERSYITKEFAKRACVPVFMTEDEVKLYYEGYANDTIWPLFHYFQSVANYKNEYWNAYEQVNKAFAIAVENVSAKNASIWVHDYHLMLLPELLRARLPLAKIGFFLHIPFPSFEIFRLLPQRTEILNGLLGADIVGFHTHDYGRHFLSSCLRLLGTSLTDRAVSYNGRHVQIGTYPIGIDYKKFQQQLAKKSTVASLKQLDESYRDEKLILSIDRLDYSKGILERLEAFRLLLDMYPANHGKVKLFMVAVPSRTEVDAYKNLRDEIEMTVSRINGTYGTIDWAPISYQFQNRPFDEIVALYARADIMLVTPIRDGMNLVAKEYVASKKDRNGVLILSEMTGAIDELPEALAVNPNDSRSIMRAIEQGLKMGTSEQRSRLDAMQRRLKTYTVEHWANAFMHDLSLADTTGSHDSKLLTPSDVQVLATNYQAASHKLVILDYDGTLKSHIKTPSALAASPSIRVLRLLALLSEDPTVTTVIVSGRHKKALQSWFFSLPKLKLVAEHGAWKRYHKQWKEISVDFKQYKPTIRAIMEEYTERTKGSLVEEKDYALVWHYINVKPELAYKRSKELFHDLKTALKSEPIDVKAGKNIIEVKPNGVSKGRIVEELLREFPADSVVCIGDDYTDEDMFAALQNTNHAVTIKVGDGETQARYRVAAVPDVIAFLESLTSKSLLPLLTKKLPQIPRKLPALVNKSIKRIRGTKD